jgi:hypothetical protein
MTALSVSLGWVAPNLVCLLEISVSYNSFCCFKKLSVFLGLFSLISHEVLSIFCDYCFDRIEYMTPILICLLVSERQIYFLWEDLGQCRISVTMKIATIFNERWRHIQPSFRSWLHFTSCKIYFYFFNEKIVAAMILTTAKSVH